MSDKSKAEEVRAICVEIIRWAKIINRMNKHVVIVSKDGKRRSLDRATEAQKMREEIGI